MRSRKVEPGELPPFKTVPLREAKNMDPANSVYVTTQMPGAIANGQRVRKVVMYAGDTHPIGAMATVIGSIGPVEGEFGYCVRWDDLPDRAVFVRGRKLERAE